MLALKHGGSNALLDLDIDGDSQLALTKQVQVDPIRRILEHIDFVAVKRGEKVIVDVPVHVTGEAGPDTLVVTENATVSIEAEATHIPEFIEVSVEGAEVGTLIHASDLDIPSGSTLLTDWLASVRGGQLLLGPAVIDAEIGRSLRNIEREQSALRKLRAQRRRVG